MKSLKIRPLRPNNEDELRRLQSIAAGQRSDHFRWNEAQLASEIQNASLVLVLEENSQILSFLVLKTNDVADEITCLATDIHHLRRGLMAELLREAINTFSQRSEIWLEVHEFNAKAIELYKKAGFFQVSLRKNYYADGGVALLMSHKKR